MKKHIYDEKNGLYYTLLGDYYLPDLELSEEEPVAYGKFGMLRKIYLKEHKVGWYQSMLLQGKLSNYLNQVDRDANERMEILTEQMVEQWGVTEELKVENPMLWWRRMDGVRNVVEEIIFAEFIFVV